MTSYSNNSKLTSLFIPTHFQYVSFPSIRTKKKSESLSGLFLPKDRSKLILPKEKKNKETSFQKYLQTKLSLPTIENEALSTDRKENAKTSKRKASQNTFNDSSSDYTQLHLKNQNLFLSALSAGDSNMLISEYYPSLNEGKKKHYLDPPDFILERTIDYERLKSNEIQERKRKIDRFESVMRIGVEQQKKVKPKKPYVKSQEDLVKDAHFVVFEREELEASRNEILKIGSENKRANKNHMKEFIKRQRKSQEEFRELMKNEKEIRFPLLFKRIFEMSPEIKTPDNNFQLFSQTPEKKSLMKNVKQTFRMIKRR